jgi:hypothetical protein
MVLNQICVFGADLKSNMAARDEHISQAWFKSVLWFQKKRWKSEIPIVSYIKLSRVMAAILNFRSDFVFGADRKSNMAARAHNVFWLVEILKIFLLETTNPIELWLCRNEHWVVLY